MDKFAVIGLILVLTVMVTGSALALWGDTLRINVTVKTGGHDPVIESYKVFKCTGCCQGCGAEDSEVTMHPDRLELNITLGDRCSCGDSHDDSRSSHGGHHEMTVWVGLVLENEGTVPSTLVSIQVAGMPDGMSIGGVYVYGPYNDGSFAREAWAHENCSTLPPSDPGTLGTGFMPGEKLVVWIELAFPGDCGPGALELAVIPAFLPGFPSST